MSKLSQRELLILLNQQVGELCKKLDNTIIELNTAKKDVIDLRLEVGALKTQWKTWGVIWGVIITIITLIINAYKLIYHG